MTDHTPEYSRYLLETWFCWLQRWLVLALVIGGVVLLPAQLARTAAHSAGAVYPTDQQGARQPAEHLQCRADVDVGGVFCGGIWRYTGGNPISQGASDYD